MTAVEDARRRLALAEAAHKAALTDVDEKFAAYERAILDSNDTGTRLVRARNKLAALEAEQRRGGRR